MPRDLDDIVNSGTTPLPPTITTATPYPQPASPQDVYKQFFAPINYAQMQQLGNMVVRSAYVNPVGAPGISMPPAGQLTPSIFSPFRTQTTIPPPVMATPGVTGLFHEPYDLAIQAQLSQTRAFVDPRNAAAAYSAMRARRWAENVGPWAQGIGTIAGVATGNAGIGLLASEGIGWLGENLPNLPGIRQFREWVNAPIARQFSYAAQLQHGTFGGLSLTGGGRGLGGAGMSTTAAFQLSSRLQQMAETSGGFFNAQDMMNLTRYASQAGLLESAQNIDQIASTVGNLMKLVGRLGKIMGDPDMQRNVRELGRLRQFGLNIQDAVATLEATNMYARQAGMTREQIAQGPGGRAMVMFGTAGLAPGLGLQYGAFGAAMGRMVRSSMDPMAAATLGDVGQNITETQAGFFAGPGRMLMLNALTAAGGRLGIDPGRVAQMTQGGAVNLTQMGAMGVNNLQQVAATIASETGRSIRGVMSELLIRMPELSSRMAQQMGPQGQMFLMGRIGAGFIQQGMDPWEAASMLAGGDKRQARSLIELMTNPAAIQRQVNALRDEADRARMEAAGTLRGAESILARGREFSLRRFLGFGSPREEIEFTSQEDVREALNEHLEMERERARKQGRRIVGTQFFLQGLADKAKDEYHQFVEQQGGLGYGPMQEYMQEALGEGEVLSAAEMRMAEKLGIPVVSKKHTFWGRAELEWTPASSVRQQLKNAASDSKLINNVIRNRFDEQFRAEQTIGKAFSKAGLDAAGHLVLLKDAVLSEARAKGEHGKAFIPSNFLKTAESLISKWTGDPKTAERFVKNNKKAILSLASGVVLQEGTPEAKAALVETAGVGGAMALYGGMSPDEIREVLYQQRKDALTALQAAGGFGEVEEGEEGAHFAKVETEEALKAFSEFGGFGEAGAMKRAVLAMHAAAAQGNASARLAYEKYKQQRPELARLFREVEAEYSRMGKAQRAAMGKLMPAISGLAGGAQISSVGQLGGLILRGMKESAAGKFTGLGALFEPEFEAEVKGKYGVREETVTPSPKADKMEASADQLLKVSKLWREALGDMKQVSQSLAKATEHLENV